MNRVRFRFAVALAAATLTAVPVFAQAPDVSQLKPILGEKKFVPPVKGQATLDIKWPPSTKKVKDMVVTTIEVKNTSPGPVARVTVDETWYDKAGNTIAGGKGIINGLLQPDEVQTVTIETPWKAGMLSNNYNFSHVNGTIKPNRVKAIEGADTKDSGKKKSKLKSEKLKGLGAAAESF